MDNLNISAEWIDDGSNVSGYGFSIEVNSRTFIAGVGIID